MIDFHVHVGESLSVASALREAGRKGFRGLGLLASSPEQIAFIRKEARELGLYGRVEAVTGLSLEHVPPALIPERVRQGREAGAAFVLVHGEGFEEAEEGSNFAAVEAGADILARPGLVDETLAAYAAEKGVALELGSAPGQAWSNGIIALRALAHGAPLIVGGEVHAPADFASSNLRRHVCLGAGLNRENLDAIAVTYRNLWQKFAKREKI